MLKRLSLMVAGALVAAATAPSAFAADLNLKLVYVQSVNSANALVNGGTGQYATPMTNGGMMPVGMVDPTDRHRFAYLINITGQALDESLKYMETRVTRAGWDVALPYNTAVSLGVYGSFSNPSYDPPQDPITLIDPPARTLFSQNVDAGASDYVDLRAETDGANEWYAAHNFNPGEGSDYYLGRMTFTLATPSTPGTYTLTLEKDGTGAGLFTMWQGGSAVPGNVVPVVADYTFLSVIPDTFTITVVPEPATVFLLGLALPAFVCLARRRRSGQ